MSNEENKKVKEEEKRFCTHCGSQIEKGVAFCSNCGNSTKEHKTPPKQEAVPIYNSPRISEQDLPIEFRPISMWGYFGYQLLFMIPCIGFILLLVFAFGGTPNKNVRNFARSYFCLFIVLFVLIFFLVVVAGISIGNSGAFDYYY